MAIKSLTNVANKTKTVAAAEAKYTLAALQYAKA